MTEIDYVVCIQSGNCTAIAPEWFRFGDEDYPVPKQPKPGEEPSQDAVAAADQCPVGAISLTPENDVYT